MTSLRRHRFVLPLPRALLLRTRKVVDAQVRQLARHRAERASLVASFRFKSDERRFITELLARKSNLWAFRSCQTDFCGDFVLVDMSPRLPAERRAYVVELKRDAPLRTGGLQLRRAAQAVREIGVVTGIIAPDAPHEALRGGREALLGYLG